MTTEEILVRLGLDGSSLKHGLKEMKDKVKEFAKDAASEFGSMFTPGRLLEGYKSILEFGKKIEEMAEATGLSVEAWQRWEFTVKSAGGTAESAERTLVKLTAKIGEARQGNAEALKLFQQYGISLGGSTAEILSEVAAKMEEMGDPTQRAALAMALFGKGAAESVNALLKWKATNGGAGLTVLSKDDLNTLKEGADTMEKFGQATRVLGSEFVIGLRELFTGKSTRDKRTKADYDRDVAAHKQYVASKADTEKKAEDDLAKGKQENANDLARFQAKERKAQEEERQKEEAHDKKMLRLKEEARLRAKLDNMRLQERLTREQATQGAPYFHSLNELAASVGWQAGRATTFGISNAAGNQAGMVLTEQEALRNYVGAYGMNDNGKMRPEVKKELDYIKSLKAPLEKLGFISPEDRLENIQDGIDALVDKMNTDGIPIQAKAG